MDFLNAFIVPIVVGICLCVGYVVKHFVPTDIVNKFIPLIVAVLGVVLNWWLNAFEFTPEILFGGMASGLASTGLYEAFAQFIKKGGN